MYTWQSEIVESIISRMCSLHSLEGVSASKEDTRTLNLWAWTSNPSTIDKVAWITFAHRADNTRPPLSEVSSCLPDKWKRGLTHLMIMHLVYIEDHTTAPLDDFIATADMPPYEPITCRLPWNLGAVDGTLESKGELSHVPPQALWQIEEVDDNLTGEERRIASDCRQTHRRPTVEDHPSLFNQRCKDDDDDGNDDHHNRSNRYDHMHSSVGVDKLCLGLGCDRDCSLCCKYVDHSYRDAGRCHDVPKGSVLHLGPPSTGLECFAPLSHHWKTTT